MVGPADRSSRPALGRARRFRPGHDLPQAGRDRADRHHRLRHDGEAALVVREPEEELSAVAILGCLVLPKLRLHLERVERAGLGLDLLPPEDRGLELVDLAAREHVDADVLTHGERLGPQEIEGRNDVLHALGQGGSVLPPAPDPAGQVELLDLVGLIAPLARVLLEAKRLEVARVHPGLVEVAHGVELRDVVVRGRDEGDPVHRHAVRRGLARGPERHLAAFDLQPRDRVDERLAVAERHGVEPVPRERLACRRKRRTFLDGAGGAPASEDGERGGGRENGRGGARAPPRLTRGDGGRLHERHWQAIPAWNDCSPPGIPGGRPCAARSARSARRASDRRGRASACPRRPRGAWDPCRRRRRATARAARRAEEAGVVAGARRRGRERD